MNLDHWRVAVAERLERWRLSIRTRMVAPIVQPVLIAILVVLVTYFASVNYDRFEEITTNQAKILAKYERIQNIDEERVLQNNRTQAALDALSKNDAALNNLCVDALRDHVRDFKDLVPRLLPPQPQEK